MTKNKTFLLLVLSLFIIAMASVSASDVSDMNDNQDGISLSEDSLGSNSVKSNLALSSADADSELVSSSKDADSKILSSSSEGSGNVSANPSKNSTSIASSSARVVKGENYSVTLKDKNGQGVSGKDLIFTLNGRNFTRTTNSKGIAILTLNTKPMKYLIKVSFLGDDAYQKSSFSQNVTVSKISTGIKTYTTYPVNGKAYAVILKDKNGKALSSKAVTLAFNGKTYKRTTNANGLASITLSGKAGNTYKLSYKFAGDSSYSASSGSASLKLKMPTKLVGSNARIVKGGSFDISLRDNNNRNLSGKKLTVLFDNKTYNKTTNSKGIVRMVLNAAPGKYYNISYKYAGSSYYAASSKALTVFIKTPTKLANSGSFVCKGNVYQVTLKDANNKALAKKPLKVTYGTRIYNLTTDSDGKAGLKINSGAGSVYNFTYRFSGDSNYGPSSGSLSLRTKLATRLSGSSSTVIKGNPYKVTLKDSTGKALANETIVFNFSGKAYNKTTNSNGIASLTIRPSQCKSYDLSYSYAGSSKYNMSSANVVLAVKLSSAFKNSGSIAVNNSTYTVTLLDSDSNPLSGKVISFEFENKTYNKTTNSKGVAGLLIVENKVKSTKLTYSFEGDSIYAASSGSQNLSVVSDKVFTFNQIVSAAKDLRKYVEKNSKLPATVSINGIRVNITSFSYLMSKAIVNLNNSKKLDVEVVPISSNYTNNGSSSINANLYKADYLDLANKLIKQVQSKNAIPNQVNTSIGLISPDLYIFGLSKALDFYSTDNYLPNYLILRSSDVSSDSSIDYTPTGKGNSSQFKKGLNEAQALNSTQLSDYLKSSGNDAINSAIQELANKLVAGKNSTWDKANAIFCYVRDNVDYEYYADTKYKATGTLSSKRGNCCDHSNLVVALCRAANMAARYSHAQGCTFSSGLYTGHVWAQIYVDGVWYTADATSSRNSLGNIHNWNTNSYNTLKQYVHLPF